MLISTDLLSQRRF